MAQPRVWFTSDLHLGHRLVSEERGFSDPESHDASIAEAWDSAVHDRDLVWILGDLSSGSSSGTRAALSWLAERPGRKGSILGNHDPLHPMNRDAHRWLHPYVEVFERVAQSATISLEGRRYLLSHFPYTGDHSPEDRHVQWRLRDEGMWLLHGHTHSASVTSQERQIHVGWDAHRELVDARHVHQLRTTLEGSQSSAV